MYAPPRTNQHFHFEIVRLDARAGRDASCSAEMIKPAFAPAQTAVFSTLDKDFDEVRLDG